MTDLNVDIAELVEPLASVKEWKKALTHDLRGACLVSAGGAWVRYPEYKADANGAIGALTWTSPRHAVVYDHSIDASMAAITRRWPRASVRLYRGRYGEYNAKVSRSFWSASGVGVAFLGYPPALAQALRMALRFDAR